MPAAGSGLPFPSQLFLYLSLCRGLCPQAVARRRGEGRPVAWWWCGSYRVGQGGEVSHAVGAGSVVRSGGLVDPPDCNKFQLQAGLVV